MSDKKVEIRPVDRAKWHGKVGAESFTREKKYRCLIDPKTNKYAISLNEKEIERLSPLAQGNLTLEATDERHPFWDVSKIPVLTLPNKTIFLDLDNNVDYIRYKIALQSKFVANSIQEYEEGKYPEATHILYDEKQYMARKATTVAMKNNCILALAKLTEAKKKALIMIIDNQNYKNRDLDAVNVKLDALIEANAEKVWMYINRDEEDNYLESLILEGIQKNTLIKKGLNITFLDAKIGSTIPEVIDFFKNPENESLKYKLISMINE